MASYNVPIKKNNEFLSVFNKTDYDVNSLGTNSVLYNDGRYLKSSGTNIQSAAVINTFNSIVSTGLKAKQNIISNNNLVLASSMTINFNNGLNYYMENSSIMSSFLFFTNIPTTSSSSYTFTFLIKPSIASSRFHIYPDSTLININGTSSIPLYGGVNYTFPGSYSVLLQTITITNTSITSTPSYLCTTSINCY